jgi:hypothetical protein
MPAQSIFVGGLIVGLLTAGIVAGLVAAATSGDRERIDRQASHVTALKDVQVVGVTTGDLEPTEDIDDYGPPVAVIKVTNSDDVAHTYSAKVVFTGDHGLDEYGTAKLHTKVAAGQTVRLRVPMMGDTAPDPVEVTAELDNLTRS